MAMNNELGKDNSIASSFTRKGKIILIQKIMRDEKKPKARTFIDVKISSTIEMMIEDTVGFFSSFSKTIPKIAIQEMPSKSSFPIAFHHTPSHHRTPTLHAHI
jgi:hypothetical protein